MTTRDLPFTLNKFEAAIGYRSDHWIESCAPFPSFDCEVTLAVTLDPFHMTISQRQLDCLNRLLKIDTDRLNEIKLELYRHWDEYDFSWTNLQSFEYDSPEKAFAASNISSIELPKLSNIHPDAPILGFSVDWDPEHGANVRFLPDRFEWCIK